MRPPRLPPSENSTFWKITWKIRMDFHYSHCYLANLLSQLAYLTKFLEASLIHILSLQKNLVRGNLIFPLGNTGADKCAIVWMRISDEVRFSQSPPWKRFPNGNAWELIFKVRHLPWIQARWTIFCQGNEKADCVSGVGTLALFCIFFFLLDPCITKTVEA